jgi:cytochrome b561
VLALDQLVFGLVILVFGAVLALLRKRVNTLRDDWLDMLHPNKSTHGRNKFNKIVYYVLMLTMLLMGAFFILWSGYTAVASF